MSVDTTASTLSRIAEFAIDGDIPAAARHPAGAPLLDPVGVTLAGASEPAARIVQQVVAGEGGDGCTILGAAGRASPASAALANGTAAHALDFDDMCFVSLAHPSAPLVAAGIAAGGVAAGGGGAGRDRP